MPSQEVLSIPDPPIRTNYKSSFFTEFGPRSSTLEIRSLNFGICHLVLFHKPEKSGSFSGPCPAE